MKQYVYETILFELDLKRQGISRARLGEWKYTYTCNMN